MHRQVGRAVARLDLAAERVIVGDLAGEGVAIERALRRERDRPRALLDAEPAMHLHGVRALLDAGADPGERVGLLVDHRFDEILAQRRRDGEAADARTDDRDRELSSAWR